MRLGIRVPNVKVRRPITTTVLSARHVFPLASRPTILVEEHLTLALVNAMLIGRESDGPRFLGRDGKLFSIGCCSYGACVLATSLYLGSLVIKAIDDRDLPLVVLGLRRHVGAGLEVS